MSISPIKIAVILTGLWIALIASGAVAAAMIVTIIIGILVTVLGAVS